MTMYVHREKYVNCYIIVGDGAGTDSHNMCFVLLRCCLPDPENKPECINSGTAASGY